MHHFEFYFLGFLHEFLILAILVLLVQQFLLFFLLVFRTGSNID